MDARAFLDVADDWSVGTREAEWRSAVSRAYYSAFHVAIGLFRLAGFAVPRGEQAHGYVWLRLANAGHPDVMAAGESLNELRRDRNRADYDLADPFFQRLAIGDVTTAASVIDLLESVKTTPHVLAQITAAMRVYERDVLHDVTWRP
jgi:hypothetical protein